MYMKPNMFRRASEYIGSTLKWGAGNMGRGVRKVPNLVASVPSGVKTAGIGIANATAAAAKYSMKNPKKAITYGIGGPLALGMGAVGIGSAVTKKAFGVANNAMRGILPNTYYPAASGRFGVRTASQAGPAGIEGLKFNFRRR